MSWFHEKDPPYDLYERFTKDELLEIYPKAVHDWMAMGVFGKTDYGDDEPVMVAGSRWNGLDFKKKALSYFMPRKKPPWCDGKGNPTKAEFVHALMRHVKQLEVRVLGAPSKAKQPMIRDKFAKELQLLKSESDWAH